MKIEKPAVRITGELEWVGPWKPGGLVSHEAVERLAEILAEVLVADIKKDPAFNQMKNRRITQPARQNLYVAEAAERLGVSPHLIRRWVARHEIPFIRLGRRIVFATSDIEAFEAQHRTEACNKAEESINGRGRGRQTGW